MTDDEKLAFGSLSYDDDRRLLPLQAADFLAYEVSKYRRGWTRKSLLALDTVRGAHEHLNAPRLAEIVNDVRQGLLDRES